MLCKSNKTPLRINGWCVGLATHWYRGCLFYHLYLGSCAKLARNHGRKRNGFAKYHCETRKALNPHNQLFISMLMLSKSNKTSFMMNGCCVLALTVKCIHCAVNMMFVSFWFRSKSAWSNHGGKDFTIYYVETKIALQPHIQLCIVCKPLIKTDPFVMNGWCVSLEGYIIYGD